MNSDIGVLLVFFNRPWALEQVFACVRKAKPSRLFLAQDGVRENCETDMPAILECREIVDNIDWECEVYKNYSESNMKCDPREFSAISWAFEYVDKLIILEDDCVPSVGFFEFMEELLLRYEDDQRIQSICGWERLGINPYSNDSYVFSMMSSGCGWSTWRRVWKEVETYADYGFLDDEAAVHDIEIIIKRIMPKCYRDFIRQGLEKRKLNEKTRGVYSWEYSFAASMVLQGRMCITSTRNLIHYVGIGAGATHAEEITLKTMPGRLRKAFSAPAYQVEFPLKHPDYVLRNLEYEKAIDKFFPTLWWRRFFWELETVILRLRYGEMNAIVKGVKNRLRRKGLLSEKG